MNPYACPWCRKHVYRHEPVVPVVGRCGECQKRIRLVGDRFLKWSEWRVIRLAAIASLRLKLPFETGAKLLADAEALLERHVT